MKRLVIIGVVERSVISTFSKCYTVLWKTIHCMDTTLKLIIQVALLLYQNAPCSGCQLMYKIHSLYIWSQWLASIEKQKWFTEPPTIVMWFAPFFVSPASVKTAKNWRHGTASFWWSRIRNQRNTMRLRHRLRYSVAYNNVSKIETAPSSQTIFGGIIIKSGISSGTASIFTHSSKSLDPDLHNLISGKNTGKSTFSLKLMKTLTRLRAFFFVSFFLKRTT
jgi:hypothetical protein